MPLLPSISLQTPRSASSPFSESSRGERALKKDPLIPRPLTANRPRLPPHQLRQPRNLLRRVPGARPPQTPPPPRTPDPTAESAACAKNRLCAVSSKPRQSSRLTWHRERINTVWIHLTPEVDRSLKYRFSALHQPVCRISVALDTRAQDNFRLGLCLPLEPIPPQPTVGSADQ